MISSREQAQDVPSWRPSRPKVRPLHLLVAWLVSATALLVAAWIVPGAAVNGFLAALAAAAVIAALNAIVPPLLAALRLPLQVLTGLILILVADALMLLAADRITDHDLQIDSFWSALGVAFVAAAVTVVIDIVLGTNDDDTYTLRVTPADRQALGRAHGHRRAGDRLPRDRRARPARAAARAARRQRADDGALGRGGHAPARRVGDRPLLPDRREPGRDPARLERGHPRLPLGREGDGEAGRLLGAARLRRDRAAARVRAGPARRRRREPREPALGRGRPRDPDRQPDGRREAREPRLPGLLRQRLQRRHGARAVLLGGRARVVGGRAGRSGATSGLAATGAASTRSCARRSASSSAT